VHLPDAIARFYTVTGGRFNSNPDRKHFKNPNLPYVFASPFAANQYIHFHRD
jgi:hypothetical protein